MSQDDSKSAPTGAPEEQFRNHWTMFSHKTGASAIALTNRAQYENLRQTYYGGGLAILAILEMRGVDLSQVDDIIGEMVQFSKSQAETAEAIKDAIDNPTIIDPAMQSKIIDIQEEQRKKDRVAAITGFDDLEKL